MAQAEIKNAGSPYSILSYPEEFWRKLEPALREQDFQLRSRYQPGWTPSWNGTNKDPRDCDDGPPRSPVSSFAIESQRYAQLFF